VGHYKALKQDPENSEETIGQHTRSPLLVHKDSSKSTIEAQRSQGYETGVHIGTLRTLANQSLPSSANHTTGTVKDSPSVSDPPYA